MMRRLFVVLAVLLSASSAFARPMPRIYLHRWYGGALGFNLNRARAFGLRTQCESEHGAWGVPRSAVFRNAGMLTCMRPTMIGNGSVFQVPVLFAFNEYGEVTGVVARIVGDAELFRNWVAQSENDLGPPQIIGPNSVAWTMHDVFGHPWYRLIARMPDGTVGYLHVRGPMPYEVRRQIQQPSP